MRGDVLAILKGQTTMAAAAMIRPYRSTKTRNRAASEPVISGLAAYVRAQCATPKSRDAYLARMGLYRTASGSLDVHPL